ncbi:MAG TPA: ABC transporter ATP-binding protein [Ignavibacteria bacterium]|nr:ABC transporter ATP-binding protein [Ignavibacteria bacterium]
MPFFIKYQMLEIKNLIHNFKSPDKSEQNVLNIEQFKLDENSQKAIYGKSGSGKTTFINCISGITKPTSGKILFNSQNIPDLNESQRDKFRSVNTGIIFQNYNLLKSFSVLENVLLGMKFSGTVNKNEALEILKRVGLFGKIHSKPKNLSSGEQQRTAIARAVVNSPKLLLADEPTANLDNKNSEIVIDLIKEICTEKGISLLLITHEKEVIEKFEDKINFDELNKRKN